MSMARRISTVGDAGPLLRSTVVDPELPVEPHVVPDDPKTDYRGQHQAQLGQQLARFRRPPSSVLDSPGATSSCSAMVEPAPLSLKLTAPCMAVRNAFRFTANTYSAALGRDPSAGANPCFFRMDASPSE